ncbi:hypothetical protein [Rathayibacter agropyri]|uniref:hypothetical protein n=1 Tax=Rathayibacter agropyri TaxID=1634927 RepID=UPI001566A138|nr:hypothetical protein [Rathayibacter agropyri]NRD08416.1 hypothetical protein [Rathayibacter agropyri]
MDGGIVYVTAYQDRTYEGRRITPGRHYDVTVQGDGPMRSLGLIDASAKGTFYAIKSYSVGTGPLGSGIGVEVRTFDEAVRALVGRA